MADLTLAQVISRIASRLNRDDLEPDPNGDFIISDYINDRINYYAKEFFYSQQFTDRSINTVVGQTWYDLPAGWEDVLYVRLNLGGVWIPLVRYWNYEDVLTEDVVEPPIQSLPSRWTTFINPDGSGNMALRLFPTPGAVYNLELTLDGPPNAPTLSTQSNFWTQDAQSLTIESVCEEICNTYLNDPIRAQKHGAAKEREELALGSKTIRIRGGIHTVPHL